MSKVVELEPPIREFCGGYIVDDDQVCPACSAGFDANDTDEIAEWLASGEIDEDRLDP